MADFSAANGVTSTTLPETDERKVATYDLLKLLKYTFYGMLTFSVKTRTRPLPSEYIYRIAGNFRGKKLSRISLFCAYQRKFSQRLFEGSFNTVGTSEQSTKVSLRNSIFHQFAKVFSRKRFLLYGSYNPNPFFQTQI